MKERSEVAVRSIPRRLEGREMIKSEAGEVERYILALIASLVGHNAITCEFFCPLGRVT